jgi:ABC-type phosphate transport system substrate-binding protein
MNKEKQIMRLKRISHVVAMALLVTASAWAQSGGYKIVVNPSNPASSISREEVARIFLKKSTRFSDGRSASPVDLAVNSPVRENFSKSVLGKPASAVDAYWQQQIFSGRDIPPPQKSESAAVSFVRSNENGIAYVSASADTAGLKVITLGD